MSLAWESRPDLLSQSISTSTERLICSPSFRTAVSTKGAGCTAHIVSQESPPVLSYFLAPTRHLPNHRWKFLWQGNTHFRAGNFPQTAHLMPVIDTQASLCSRPFAVLEPLPAASCSLGGKSSLSTWYCLHLVGAKWCSQCRFPRKPVTPSLHYI